MPISVAYDYTAEDYYGIPTPDWNLISLAKVILHIKGIEMLAMLGFAIELQFPRKNVRRTQL